MANLILAETNRTIVSVGKETDWASVGTDNDLENVRITGETLTHVKKTVVSNTIRPDRSRDFLAEVAASAEGDIDFELAFGGLDKFFEAAFFNDFVTVSLTSKSIAVDVSGTDAILTMAAGGFTASGIVAGMNLKLKGFTNAGNNKVVKVKAVTSDTVITLVGKTGMATEAGGGDESITGKMLRNGTTANSLLIEKKFDDLTTQYMYFPGCKVSTLSLDAKVGAICTGKMKVMAQQGINTTTSRLGAGTLTETSTTDFFNSTANLGNILADGAALTTAFKSLTMELNNNLREKTAIGNKFLVGVGAGFLDLTGSIDAYFADSALFNKFVNHESMSLSFQFTDLAGNAVIFTLPRIYLSKCDVTSPGGNQDVMAAITYTAIREAATNCTIQVDFLAA